MNELWGVVIVAAGRGTRMGTSESKQYLQLGDRPILVHTLERFQMMKDISEIVLVVSAEDVERCQQWRDQYNIMKLKVIIPGGTERQHSVYAGLQHIESSWVMVHDGVRPFVSEYAVKACCAKAVEHGAAVLAVPVKDTIKQVNSEGVITATPDRKSLWAIQTPQAFRHDLLLQAHEDALTKGLLGTDDAMVVEWAGLPVVVSEGEYTNIKITTPEDLPWAEQLLSKMDNEIS
ncbi:2-C-methyl-D-erythritol 4-phosphate cytidylyltransferase [Paenibacillus endoradicis]|uniref:2-C-methyl-D-erythritol 4-phosphate cytidylyltransferase n=1 Tax=Paenibacillus endoradicis TaxID=2972487 RepID=UPI0021598FEE|nr:2-C-methyl-D-erythritol 4-phosphate cytidylyltransferase [Paenibacillus endoradicis]MCR8660744.1 2-C-methyl-D-erythritol 4-phosphate cytidylyltransferase [Paenibacillus endoradicis]